MTTQQKQDFKKMIDEEILTLSPEIAKVKVTIYPKNAGTFDKIS